MVEHGNLYKTQMEQLMSLFLVLVFMMKMEIWLHRHIKVQEQLHFLQRHRKEIYMYQQHISKW